MLGLALAFLFIEIVEKSGSTLFFHLALFLGKDHMLLGNI